MTNRLGVGFISTLIIYSMSIAPSFATDWCFEYQKNKETADKAIETCTEDIDGGKYSSRNLATRYLNRGNAYKDKGLYDRAIQDYDRAIELDPKYADAYYNRGNAYKDKGLYDRAIQNYDRAIELDPKDAFAYYNRGNAYQDKGLYDRAIQDYDRAIELDPKYAVAYYNRGNAYNNKGLYDRAIQDYDRAIELDPKDAFAYNNRGNAYKNKGLYDRAIQDYDRAIELNPKREYGHLMSIIAAGYLSRTERERKLERLRRFVADNGSDKWGRTISLYYIGEITEKQMIAEAKKGKDTKETNERLCEAYYYAGEAWLFKKNRKSAAEYFEKTVKTNVLNFMEYHQAKAAILMMQRKK
jgi:tetratricopeptide (TPR) repeat protein